MFKTRFREIISVLLILLGINAMAVAEMQPMAESISGLVEADRLLAAGDYLNARKQYIAFIESNPPAGQLCQSFGSLILAYNGNGDYQQAGASVDWLCQNYADNPEFTAVIARLLEYYRENMMYRQGLQLCDLLIANSEGKNEAVNWGYDYKIIFLRMLDCNNAADKLQQQWQSRASYKQVASMLPTVGQLISQSDTKDTYAIAWAEIKTAMDKGQHQQLIALFEQLLKDYAAQQRRLLKDSAQLVHQYMQKGYRLNNYKDTEEYIINTIKLIEILEQNLPICQADSPLEDGNWTEILMNKTKCYEHLKKYEQALQTLEYIISNYPETSKQWRVLYCAAMTTHILQSKGLIASEQAEKNINKYCQRIVESFPYSPVKPIMVEWLEQNTIKENVSK